MQANHTSSNFLDRHLANIVSIDASLIILTCTGADVLSIQMAENLKFDQIKIYLNLICNLATVFREFAVSFRCSN